MIEVFFYVVLVGFVALVFILFVWGITIYNRLVALRQGTDASWAQIDVQLKRRYDLIPNLVETVKGYAAHEKTVFENVTKARAAAVNAQQQGPAGAAQLAQAENMLTGALKSLFAVAEAYPQLKANENFLQLQAQLGETENLIAGTREMFNESVRVYNTVCQMFPSRLIAGFFGFAGRNYFETDVATERQAPQVRF